MNAMVQMLAMSGELQENLVHLLSNKNDGSDVNTWLCVSAPICADVYFTIRGMA